MSQIELILKSPTDRVAPFSVKCDNTWNIKDLKLHIQVVYPCKPKVESQKLIYSGKLLKDEQILKDIFESDTSAIVHFICQPSVNTDEEKKKAADNNNTKDAPNPEAYKEYQNYLNNFYSSSMQSFVAMDQYQQMAVLNHAYMQSYASYYNQWSNRSEPGNSAGAPCTEVLQRSVTNDTPNQENPPNNERRIEPAGENGMQNMMAAAFGGLMGDGGEDENDGDAEPRDLLHYFYMFVRFGLLLLICYYYSSMFSVVTTLMLFFLFFGVNFFRRNNPVIRPVRTPVPENAPAPPENAPASPENAPAPTDPVPVPEETPDNVVPEPPTEVVAPPAPPPGMSDRLRRVASTSIQFVVTFFVTLFPDPVAHINVN